MRILLEHTIEPIGKTCGSCPFVEEHFYINQWSCALFNHQVLKQDIGHSIASPIIFRCKACQNAQVISDV